jgi:hypothetical protein
MRKRPGDFPRLLRIAFVVDDDDRQVGSVARKLGRSVVRRLGKLRRLWSAAGGRDKRAWGWGPTRIKKGRSGVRKFGRSEMRQAPSQFVVALVVDDDNRDAGGWRRGHRGIIANGAPEPGYRTLMGSEMAWLNAPATALNV